jgi:iron complex transport system substrate-binding protein
MIKICLSVLMGIAVLFQPVFASGWPKEVTDVLGNKVVLEKAPERIILASGYSFLSLAFVDPKPTAKLVAWGSELKRFDEKTYSLFLNKFPELATLTTIGSGSGNDLSAEVILALQPDLIIMDAWQKEGSATLVEHLQNAGIKIVYIDYYMSPLKHTVPSTRLLGQIMDREEQAEALISFYQSHMDNLTSRLDSPKVATPKVFIHAYAGVWACCWSSGSGGLGEYLELFKGRNIGATAFPNANGGTLNLEYVLMEDPDIYIATGHSGVDPQKGLPIGTGVSRDLALRQLKKIVSTPGLDSLTAVEEKRVYGFWNYFSGSPFNVVGAEALAKWIQPELYQDIDPQKTMDEMNRRFLSQPLEGTYWVSLD